MTATHVRELVEEDIVFDQYPAIINATDFGALVHVWSEEDTNVDLYKLVKVKITQVSKFGDDIDFFVLKRCGALSSEYDLDFSQGATFCPVLDKPIEILG